ncbi:MAG: FadR/GntR family transcriptional regulator [Albidovulum sp.]|nr:FadR/GntR family transcriptional regulator [Albidovulum sp.]MDE0306312.1 FadR/GntR family transcriptional regulator [Albidovulum sp.]MDE0531353.1 FadR/GntR family transcriptional regulator [Albidovulum sp.]
MAETLAIEPIQRENVATIIVDRLLGFVKAGKLNSGDRLPSERQLAERFGVSRPTIREALSALSALGVVEINHGGGIFVSRLDATDLLQPLTFFLTLESVTVDKLYEARRLIEGEIAALAAHQAMPEDLGHLEELLTAQAGSLGDAAEYRTVDTIFHDRLAMMATNPFLMRAAQSLNMLGQEFRHLASETPSVLAGSLEDHKVIVAAVRAAEPELARKAMADHMENVLRTTREAARKSK